MTIGVLGMAPTPSSGKTSVEADHTGKASTSSICHKHRFHRKTQRDRHQKDLTKIETSEFAGLEEATSDSRAAKKSSSSRRRHKFK
jgi:hypothetical protein